MAAYYTDHVAGSMHPETDMYFQMPGSGYYGLTPTLKQQADYLGQEAGSFDYSMFIDQPASPGPGQQSPYKRAFSSSESVDQAQVDGKKPRLQLLHADSGLSVSTAVPSTASSINQDSPSEFSRPSPPSDQHSNAPSPMQEPSRDLPGRAWGLPSALPPTLPSTSSGQTPSVLLPNALYRHQIPAQEFAQLQARAAALQHAQSGRPNHPAPEAAEPVHATRRSKAAAMQHLEEVAIDEQDDEMASAPPKSKSQGKRATRKKGAAKPAVVVPEPQPIEADDETRSVDGDDDDKRVQFLERNRLAACKSRQKKKEWIRGLEEKGDDLARQNKDLQMLVTALREEITSLRGALTSHAQCSCQIAEPDLATSQAIEPPLPLSAEAATYAAAPWVGIGEPGKEAAGPGQPPSVIDFHHGLQPTGLTPFLNPAVEVNDYFGQPFSARPALDTPELARSLGFTA